MSGLKFGDSLTEWLDSRPAAIRALAIKYPPGLSIYIKGVPHFVVGYTEHENGVGLYVSTTSPREDYDKAMASIHLICPCCLEQIHKNKEE